MEFLVHGATTEFNESGVFMVFEESIQDLPQNETAPSLTASNQTSTT
jgi:hypothetical protein